MVVRANQQAKAPDFQADFFEITQALEALKSKLEGASGTTSAPAPKPEVNTNSLGFYCDENGCVLLSGPSIAKNVQSSDSVSWELEEELSGNGWVLGLTGEDGAGYCATVGGTGWSVSLTLNELKDFVTALRAIRDAMRKLSADSTYSGDSEEGVLPIKVKWTTKTVTMEAAASNEEAIETFRLSFNIGVGGLRLVRGAWSAEVVADVLATLDRKLPGFALAIPVLA